MSLEKRVFPLYVFVSHSRILVDWTTRIIETKDMYLMFGNWDNLEIISSLAEKRSLPQMVQ